MLDRKWLLDNLDEAERRLATREPGLNLGGLAELDRRRRELLVQAEDLRRQRKERSSEIGQRKRAGEDTTEAQEAVRQIGNRISQLEDELQGVSERLDGQLLELPNLPLDEVPTGADETGNVVDRSWGEPAPAADWRRPHWEVGEARGIFDLERAAKTSGSRFAFMTGPGARLELALARFMLDHHAARGYEELIPPYLVRPAALVGTGQLPKFADDLFRADEQDLYLIPTAEVPVTNMFADEILGPDDLPRKYVAFSPCFRAEAGAAGQDTRGIIRVHQFHKVELVRFERPEAGRAALDELLADAESVLQTLEIPYRVNQLCTGDTGFSSALTYDLEVWLPGQERWLEISSCSTFTDFQARRANVRFRPDPEAKPRFVHTLNGSGLAVGRTVVAILEHFQRPDGTVTVPEVLRESMKADSI